METHNVNENYKRTKEGGTGIIEFDTILGWMSVSGSDRTVLVILCGTKLQGKNGHV